MGVGRMKANYPTVTFRNIPAGLDRYYGPVQKRGPMQEFVLLEASTREDLSSLLTAKTREGWELVSLHVTERANGTPRYTVLLAKKETGR